MVKTCYAECSEDECEYADVDVVYCIEKNEYLPDKYLYQCTKCKRVWAQ